MTRLDQNSLPELFAAMRETSQDAKWHPEGDVLTHAYMVHKMCQWRGWHILSWAALLHDAGKVTTTDTGGGKVTAYGHEKVSADLVRLLRGLPIWPTTDHHALTEYVVRNHMRIKHIEQMRPYKADRMRAEGVKVRVWHRHTEDPSVAYYTTGWEALRAFSRFDGRSEPAVSYLAYDKPNRAELDRFLRVDLPDLYRNVYGPPAVLRRESEKWRLESSRERLVRRWPKIIFDQPFSKGSVG